MAERNRRGDSAAEEPLDLDEAFDDAVDDDADATATGGGGTATKARTRRDSGGDKATRTRDRPERVGLFARIGRFFREVVAELRKVIWPNRKELRNYTLVVVVFVAAMLTLVGLLDFGFAKAVLWVFGNPE